MSTSETSPGTRRKPRIALMGEFSAGKSTLSNLLMGQRPLPEKVTATRLSPVWISYGSRAPYRVGTDGTKEPVSIEQLESIPVEETHNIRLFLEADILEVCDLIDFPGISDPNMSSSVWERMLPEVDAVIWCTHATQAWRQSEAAVWEHMPQAVRENSTLLITRFDKLTNDKDRSRVVKRVTRETQGQFGAVFPVSLLQAIQAGDNYALWEASGAGPFTAHLIDVIERLTALTARAEMPLYNIGSLSDIPEQVAPAVVPRRVQRAPDSGRSTRDRTSAEPSAGSPISSTDGVLRSS
jgi:hypothetical protein